ncbi:MAG: hypothetical protein GY758_13230 [Fuerstiella sp.]|nr:hypothetical protein [Fuerstiella sp.]MCP4511264.1 hypothetical protein [Fuerstiella sp.]MDG2130152.1 hypothetical protein [Fuerstiella sp.]
MFGAAHWATSEGDTRVVALFAGSRHALLLNQRLINDRRTDLRYPVDLQAFIRGDRCQQQDQVINYSLHGLCLVSSIAFDVHRHSLASVICDHGSSWPSVLFRWITKGDDGTITGRSLRDEHGVLLTRRHAKVCSVTSPADLSSGQWTSDAWRD